MRKSALVLIILFSFTPFASAYDLPSVNLGFTSFMDGGPPAGPGFYLTQYVQYWTADEFTDTDGDADKLFPVSDPDFDAWISLTQFIYQSDRPLLWGGKWGIDVIVPVVDLDVDFDGMSFIHDNGTGIGDILVGPFLQWDPIMGPNGPRFMHRIELQLIFPTGEYDDDKTLNAGSNFFSFNPYWAGTLFITPSWTLSTRIHYLWNDENDDPNDEAAPNSPYFGADEVQAGQAIHLNLASAYELVPKTLRVGLNAYYLKQITETEVDGHDVDDSEEMVFGIGPGALWHISPDAHLFFNAYFETDAENRPKGERFQLRCVYHF
jgi:hypothetical protein